jgi:Xaa-Pro aminopeptidase
MKSYTISDDEFRARVRNVQALMPEMNLDILLAFSTESEPAYVRYLADYWPSFETAAVLIPASGDPWLLIGPESLTYARSRSRIASIAQLRDFRESSQPAYPGSNLPDWAALLRDTSFETCGIAGWQMFPQAIYSDLATTFPGASWTNADDLLRRVMIRKSPAELDCLRQAAKLSEAGLKAIVEKIKPGMTEIQVAAIGAAAMLDKGAESTGYPVWCCSGPNSNQAISRPTHRRIGTGEVVQVCVGAKVAGYSASIGRPLLLGNCPPDVRSFLEAGRNAENLTFELLRAGTPAGKVAQQVHDFIRQEGYGDTLLYGPAHGCGQMECEYPFVETSSTFALEKDMTFMVDIFLANKEMGFRWEDGAIVGEGSAEQLSSFNREVVVL